MEAKGLKLNTGKTKVMFNCSMKDKVEVYVRGELAIIRFYDTVAKGSLLNASPSIICRCCKVDRLITDGLNTDLHLDIGNGISLEKVDKLCYLRDTLDADGGCDSAVTASQICLKKVS